MAKFTKLFLFITFSIIFLSACDRDTVVPTPDYDLNGIYELTNTFTVLESPEDYSSDSLNETDLSWEFATQDRTLTLIEEYYYPRRYDSANVNASSSIENNKSTITAKLPNNTFDIQYDLELTLTSNDAFTYTGELFAERLDGSDEDRLKLKLEGTGALAPVYSLTDGTYEVDLELTESTDPDLPVGSTVDISYLIETTGELLSFSTTGDDPSTLTAPIKYNRVIFENTTTSFTAITMTDNDAFDLIIVGFEDDGSTVEVLFEGTSRPRN